MKFNSGKHPEEPILSFIPASLVEALAELQKRRGEDLFISGGTVRDWLLSRSAGDIDITVKNGAEDCCRELLSILQGGVLVKLGTDTEEAARVVWQGCSIDFSSFRKGASSIEEELSFRDYTINSIAVALSKAGLNDPGNIIDPLQGRRDLVNGILQNCEGAFKDDPLRMLRGYRLLAELGFSLSSQCRDEIQNNSSKIKDCAAERILYELDRIMSTSRAAEAIGKMANNGLLWHIVPELQKGVGLEQPGFHHEDVFHHSLLALECLEKVIEKPRSFFSEHFQVVEKYLSSEKRCCNLRWSALFHDLGKPATRSATNMAGGRITFYNHDRMGRQIFEEIAVRLRMSRSMRGVVGKLVEMHMHPFHLCNAKKKSPLSRKALLKICKKAGDELVGLFVIAMADSLAGQGELKPADMEDQLAALFAEVQFVNEQYVKPALHGERFLTGRDLIDDFHLVPGPIFKTIFTDLEVARVEGLVSSRKEAVAWLRKYLDVRNLQNESDLS